MEENEITIRKEETMSVSDWFVTLLLCSVPVLNVIMLIIWGFGGEAPKNKSNFAKATLIWIAISFVLGGIVALVVISALAKVYGLF